MKEVTSEGLQQHQTLLKMLNNAFFDNHTHGLISLFNEGSAEFNADIIGPFEICSNTILSSLHWGFIYKDKFIAHDDKTIFADNFKNVPMYELYSVGGSNVNIPYIAVLTKVNPNEIIVMGKNTILDVAVVGIVNLENHTITTTTKMTSFGKVLGELHSTLLPQYLTRSLVGGSNE